jgi:hypothetical protein
VPAVTGENRTAGWRRGTWGPARCAEPGGQHPAGAVRRRGRQRRFVTVVSLQPSEAAGPALGRAG